MSRSRRSRNRRKALRTHIEARRHSEERLYFAYGSNLNIVQMYGRCKTAVAVRRFSIRNWKLVFRDVADIERSAGSVVHGALYRVTEDDIVALDIYEGVKGGLYRRVNFRIPDTDEQAFFYVMNDDFVCPPSRHYFNTIVQGYCDWQIPLENLDTAYDESFEWIDAEEVIEAQSELDLAYDATMASDDWDDKLFREAIASSRQVRQISNDMTDSGDV